MKRSLLFLALFSILAVQTGWAQIPQTISYQGVLADPDGTPVADGSYTIAFSLYDVETGGLDLWTETQSLEVQDGIFNAILGSVAAFPSELAFDAPYWLGIKVDANPELPRIPLTASPYSLNARTVEDNAVSTAKIQNGAVTAEKLASGVGGGNTLDEAYDEGGAGAGATITADAGPVTINGDQLYVQAEGAGRLRVGAAWLMPGLYSGDDGAKDLMLGVPQNNKVYLGHSTGDAWIKGGTGDVYLKGKVGIGTEATEDKLDVAGTLRILSDSNPIRFTEGWTGFPGGASNRAEISNDTDVFKSLMIVGNRSADGATRKVSVWDRLDVPGSLWTGTAEMGGFKLTASPSAGYVLTSDVNGVGTWQPAGAASSLWSTSGNDISYSNGNVGIGTSTPGDGLHVVGGITANGQVSPTGIGFPGTFGADGDYVGTAGNYLAFGHVGNSEDFIGYKDNTFYFKDSPGGGDESDPNVVIGGNVGIGTMAPEKKLHVEEGELRVRASHDNIDADIGAFYAHNLTQGIGIGYNRIQAIGTSPSQDIVLYPKGGGKVDVTEGDLEIDVGRLMGHAIDHGFTYDGKHMGWYTLGWMPDSWNPGGHTAWIAGWGGIKFFTGSATPAAYITSAGHFYAAGNISCGQVKSFRIPHPTEDGKDLVHAAVEGPEAAVFYRGEAQLANGTAEITLPDYFEALTRQEDRTAQLTCKNGWSPLYVDGEIADGKLVVKTADAGDPSQAFYWEVKAVRADVAPLEVEVPSMGP